MAAVNGGVWKTTDAGRTWKPIFDDQPTGSIGTIAIAPSNAEHPLRRQRRGAAPPRPLDRRRRLQVDRRGQDVDAPRAARRAADSQHRRSIRRTPIGCSSRRSAIPTARTKSAASIDRTDGGKSFQKVLSKDENTGGNDVDIDPSNPDVVYATMWEERQGPWENSVWAGTQRRHLQVDRRRHDVEAAHQRTARRSCRRTSRSRRRTRKRLYAARGRLRRARHERRARRRRDLPQRRCRRDVDADHHRHPPGRAHRRRRPADADRASEESRTS